MNILLTNFYYYKALLIPYWNELPWPLRMPSEKTRVRTLIRGGKQRLCCSDNQLLQTHLQIFFSLGISQVIGTSNSKNLLTPVQSFVMLSCIMWSLLHKGLCVFSFFLAAKHPSTWLHTHRHAGTLAVPAPPTPHFFSPVSVAGMHSQNMPHSPSTQTEHPAARRDREAHYQREGVIGLLSHPGMWMALLLFWGAGSRAALVMHHRWKAGLLGDALWLSSSSFRSLGVCSCQWISPHPRVFPRVWQEGKKLLCTYSSNKHT